MADFFLAFQAAPRAEYIFLGKVSEMPSNFAFGAANDAFLLAALTRMNSTFLRQFPLLIKNFKSYSSWWALHPNVYIQRPC